MNVQITYGNSAIVSGYVSDTIESDQASHEKGELFDTDKVTLTAKDVYTIMRLKGYSYK